MSRPEPDIRIEVKRIIAEMAKLDESTIEAREWVTAYGIDSLALVVLRERIEQRLGVYILDDVWLDFRSIEDIVAFVASHAQDLPRPVGPAAEPEPGSIIRPGMRLSTGGILHDELEIGMPYTGLVNLAEAPLLKHLGDLRWAHISAVCGAASRDIADQEGHRLYPTFFYVDIAFPESRPMGSFRENDVLKMSCTLARYGGSMLDGVTY
ncbi:MAG: acyl carrier protein, partial [Planctomycetota bacterium]